MHIEFDSEKNDKNIRERGISFELAEYFDPELIDDENPEWTPAMLNEAKSMAELFPHLFKESENKAKISTTISYDADVISTFRAMGQGWEKRVNDALREWLQEHAL